MSQNSIFYVKPIKCMHLDSPWQCIIGFCMFFNDARIWILVASKRELILFLQKRCPKCDFCALLRISYQAILHWKHSFAHFLKFEISPNVWHLKLKIVVKIVSQDDSCNAKHTFSKSINSRSALVLDSSFHIFTEKYDFCEKHVKKRVLPGYMHFEAQILSKKVVFRQILLRPYLLVNVWGGVKIFAICKN